MTKPAQNEIRSMNLLSGEYFQDESKVSAHDLVRLAREKSQKRWEHSRGGEYAVRQHGARPPHPRYEELEFAAEAVEKGDDSLFVRLTLWLYAGADIGLQDGYWTAVRRFWADEVETANAIISAIGWLPPVTKDIMSMVNRNPFALWG